MAASTTVSSFGSLSVTLDNAIAYLTRSLIQHYSATTVIKLQLALEANLTAQFAPSWVPTEPLRGSGRRCLTLSPSALPPRPVYNACKTANVEWSQWIATLGGIEFDLFIDPGCVSIRFGNWDSGKVSKFLTVWSEELATGALKTPLPQGMSLAQQLLETDKDEDEQIFTMIADEMREPTWLTPMLEKFPAVPAPPRSTTSSPDSLRSVHSRSSSSSSSSGFSFSSISTTASNESRTTLSASSHRSSPSPSEEQPQARLSRRERARQARVFIDKSKKEVTNYDGGKTTVLTGGVMLGAVRPASQIKATTPKKTNSASSSWRSSRA
ncbi:hypothetical protein POSPLADRAFT_1064277 [Postia placenta MAD-698-R-SB12]|uniref:Anti-proliferative protein domain-containing protein n=1 Tax=Postia placenta MAD-698-R-SB12 TaxID=670580 RepID=A0A1X6NGK8_9APHY|nr:hypothetical protein POSPLADRAFT_1064277 [Postia placenta MAD-698-R-SB12]OSX67781.1 hypothetical protein POSPLADRAFT_1064277 [Postia placenta MAD-698-R-SB12]